MNLFGKSADIVDEIITNPATEGTENVGNQTQSALNQLASKGIKQTKTTAELQSIANAIFQAGYVYNIGGIDEHPDVIYRELSKMQNDADIMKLIQLFGSKKRYTFGLPSTNPMDLFTFVKHVLADESPSNMDTTYIDLINQNWSSPKKQNPIKARL